MSADDNGASTNQRPGLSLRQQITEFPEGHAEGREKEKNTYINTKTEYHVSDCCCGVPSLFLLFIHGSAAGTIYSSNIGGKGLNYATIPHQIFHLSAQPAAHHGNGNQNNDGKHIPLKWRADCPEV